jgi:hypothetical protein
MHELDKVRRCFEAGVLRTAKTPPEPLSPAVQHFGDISSAIADLEQNIVRQLEELVLSFEGSLLTLGFRVRSHREWPCSALPPPTSPSLLKAR